MQQYPPGFCCLCVSRTRIGLARSSTLDRQYSSASMATDRRHKRNRNREEKNTRRRKAIKENVSTKIERKSCCIFFSNGGRSSRPPISQASTPRGVAGLGLSCRIYFPLTSLEKKIHSFFTTLLHAINTGSVVKIIGHVK